MGQRDFGLLLVPIVALLALFVPAARSSGPAPAVAAAPAPAPLAAINARADAATLLSDYRSTGANPGDAQLDAAKAEPCVIATLPDPIDAANLSYTYDRYLDAIQRAMEGADYLLDRFDVPWLDRKPAASADAPPRFRAEPGRLLFRKRTRGEGPLPVPAFIFIVGETPTGGIHKAAFSQAVRELTATCSNPYPIRVLGPSFSGSDTSLHALLVAHKNQTFRIVSGSATAIRSADLVRDTGATFQSTIAQDVDARNQYFAYLAGLENTRAQNRLLHLWHRLRGADDRKPVQRTKVALLVESSTAFGSDAAQRGAPKPPIPQNARAPVAADRKYVEPIAEQVPPSIELIRIPFPLHISSLRVAARDSDTAGTASKEEKAVRALTHLDLRNPPPAHSVLPLFSAIEPSSIEIVISTLLDTLEDEHVRYIGVVATDIQDRVFLSQQIRHHLPNTVLFLFSSDLLYLHSDISVDMRGAQIVTSYPLFHSNQEWTPAASIEAARLLFPTHTTQGVYNAALALLGLDNRMQEYGYPLDDGRPSAVWMSEVGVDQLWPVALLGQADARDMIARPKLEGAVGPLTMPYHPWLPTVILVTCVLPAAYIMANFLAWFPHRSAFMRGTIAQIFSDNVYGDHRLPRRLYLLACWAALLCAYLLMSTTFLLPVFTDPDRKLLHWSAPAVTYTFVFLLYFGGAVMFLTTILVMFLTWEGALEERTSRRRLRALARLGSGLLAAGLVVLTLFVCAQWLGLANGGHRADAILLYLRSSDVTSGVSPLLPLVLICAASVVSSISGMRRLRMLEGPNRYQYVERAQAVATLPHSNSFLGLDGKSFEGVRALEQEVFDAIGHRTKELPARVLMTVLALLLLAWWRLFGPRAVPTPEGTAFDALFAAGFLVVYTGLALSFVRFVFVWRKLLRLLRRLAWHPTVSAYARLRDKIPGKPKINLTSPSQIFTALEFSVDRATRLVAVANALVGGGSAGSKPEFTRALEAIRPDLESYVAAAEAALHRALEAEAHGEWSRMIRQRTIAEQQLSLVARAVTEIILPAWRLPLTGAPLAGKDKPDEQYWFQLAEDFLTSRVGAFLSHVVPQLQNLIVCVTTGLLLMLLAVTAYPFQPRQLLLLFNTIVIVAVATVTLVVFVQMERDTILSVLSESEPGQINWNRDFVSRIAVYVVLPIISLLGAQFPEVSQQLFTWTSSFFGTH